MKQIFFFTIIFLFLFTSSSSAQRGWELGGWAGVSHYFGDLNTSLDLKHPNFAAGGVFRFNFNDRICAKLGANYGSIGANDNTSTNPFELRRNTHFKSIIIDGSAQVEFNFMSYDYFDKSKWFTPYLFGGIGVYHFNPQAKYKGVTYDLRPLGTEGQFAGEEYYTTQPALVYGGGVKMALNEVWSINVELSMRKLFTDYLDDVSKTYPNMNDLRKAHGEVAVALSDPSLTTENQLKVGQLGRQRGDAHTTDTFTFFGVSLLYYFGDLRCPPISNR